MITRTDVARLAGVSAAVVSYVVNDGPRPVAPKTRAKVEAAIAELGYRPNIHATALKGGKTHTVAVLLPNLTNPFFAEFAQILGSALFEAGFQLSVSVVNSATSRERDVVAALIDRGVDAIVFTAPESVHNTLNLMRGKVKSVLFDSETEIAGSYNVTAKNVSLGSAGVQYLHSLGHSLIGVVAGPRHSQQSKLRVRGWRQDQKEAGYPYGPELVVHSAISSEGVVGALSSSPALMRDSYPLMDVGGFQNYGT